MKMMKKPLKKPISWSFYKTLLKTPRSVGAITPTFPHLAQELVKLMPKTQGLIVELGAGTGAVTKVMRENGITDNRLILIEQSRYLADTLKTRFPNVEIHQRSAGDLIEILSGRALNVDIIISTLPLTSMPDSARQKILNGIERILRPNSYYIQYTYRKDLLSHNPKFKKIMSKKVWLNFPPARIDVFKVIT